MPYIINIMYGIHARAVQSYSELVLHAPFLRFADVEQRDAFRGKCIFEKNKSIVFLKEVPLFLLFKKREEIAALEKQQN